AAYKPIAPILRWFGGKGDWARELVSLLPPHRHYVEAFAGGLSVLLAKDPEGVSEVVNDLYGDLVNFWRVPQGEGTVARRPRLLPAVPVSEAGWDDARALLDGQGETDPIKRAAAFFVCCRQSFSGAMQSFGPLTRKRTRRGLNEQASTWL